MIKRNRTEFGWVRQELKPSTDDPPQIAPITESDEKQLELMMRAALHMARQLKLIGEDTAYLTPHQLDICWGKVPPKPENPIEELFVTLLFGAPLGEYFVLKHNMYWCRYIDENGSNLAIHHRDVWVTAFPLASVQKRILPSEPPFFRAIEATLLQQIATCKKAKEKLDAELAAEASSAANEKKAGDEPAEAEGKAN